MLSLSINKHLDYSNPIFFVPLGINTTNTSTPQIKPAPIKTNTPAQKVVTPKSVTPATPAKTDVKKPTTVAAVIPKKPEPIKQEIAKKPEPAKPEVTQKTDVKKEVVKADVKKPEPIKQEEKPAPIAQAIDTQQTIVPIVPDNAHVSHNYREVEALRKQAQLQKELVQTWKPPIGISPDCMCEISFFVTSKGTIENIKMVKSSGVVMFDISARQALFAMKMPQWTYGKPFTINFKE